MGSADVISYSNLWETMKKRGVTQYALIHRYKVSPAQITRLKRNEYVSIESIERICRVMNCGVDDILEFVPEEKRKQEE